MCVYILTHLALAIGKAAIEAKNLFYYLTYPGSINLESMDDMNLKRVSVIQYFVSLYLSLNTIVLNSRD